MCMCMPYRSFSRIPAVDLKSPVAFVATTSSIYVCREACRRWLPVQVAQRCAGVQQLEASQVEHKHPDWLASARAPVLVGGYIGFPVAYCVGLYTIFHVAKAYKKLDLKVRRRPLLCFHAFYFLSAVYLRVSGLWTPLYRVPLEVKQ